MKRLAFLTSRFQWQGQASAVRAAAKGFGADVVDLPVDLPTSEADYRGAIAKAKGDIPFYQASKFELSLNLKTAKTLSLSVPATLLAAADKVVE